jgi:hypothetical protein
MGSNSDYDYTQWENPPNRLPDGLDHVWTGGSAKQRLACGFCWLDNTVH